MLRIADRDTDTVFVYGTNRDITEAMKFFHVIEITTYENFPSLVIKKESFKKVN